MPRRGGAGRGGAGPTPGERSTNPGALGIARSGPDEDRPARRVRPEVRKPNLPQGVRPTLPGAVRRELRQHVRTRELGDEVGLALMLGGDAIDDDVPEEALPFLEWAKQVAPRAPSIREALAAARYLLGDYKAALNEIRTYRRLSGSSDQDHLLADCMRANGATPTEVGEVVQAMLGDDEVPAERRVEGLLVWAGAVGDTGDVAAARAVLRRATRQLVDEAGDEARERMTYLVGVLAEQAGERDAAVAAFRRLAALEDDPYDVVGRLEALDGPGTGT